MFQGEKKEKAFFYIQPYFFIFSQNQTTEVHVCIRCLPFPSRIPSLIPYNLNYSSQPMSGKAFQLVSGSRIFLPSWFS
jgi:hypothetical protein